MGKLPGPLNWNLSDDLRSALQCGDTLDGLIAELTKWREELGVNVHLDIETESCWVGVPKQEVKHGT